MFLIYDLVDWFLASVLKLHSGRHGDPISEVPDRFGNAKRFKRLERERRGRFSSRSESDRQKFGW